MRPTRDAGLKLISSTSVFDVLFMWCSPGALRRILRTCRAAQQAVNSYLLRTLNINKLLSRFFAIDDVLAFRNLQAQLEFVISGSQALQLLDRIVYPDADLDVYVFPLDGERVGRWLMARGYEFVPSSNDIPTFERALSTMPPLPEDEDRATRADWEKYGAPAIRRVLCFKKRTDGADVSVPLAQDRTALEVQVIVALTAPIHTVVNFHATMAMNFVTWNKAIALYPRATFEERRALLTCSDGSGVEPAMLKYSARGYRIQRLLFAEDTRAGAFAFGRRWVGDGRCWVVKLNTVGVAPPAHRLQIAANCWELGYAPKHDERRVSGPCVVRTASLRSIIFRYRYSVTQDFLDYLFYFLCEQGCVEAARLHPDYPGYEPAMNVAYGMPKPAGYTFWDSELRSYKDRFLANLNDQQRQAITENDNDSDWDSAVDVQV